MRMPLECFGGSFRERFCKRFRTCLRMLLRTLLWVILWMIDVFVNGFMHVSVNAVLDDFAIAFANSLWKPLEIPPWMICECFYVWFCQSFCACYLEYLVSALASLSNSYTSCLRGCMDQKAMTCKSHWGCATIIYADNFWSHGITDNITNRR